MKNLYAPWRSSYTTGVARAKKQNTTAKNCIFCSIIADHKNDKTNFLLKRNKHSIVLLNRYPYNAGHLLVIPNAHKKSLHLLTPQERAELMEELTETTTLVTNALKADGVNIGLNLGKAAGAGIPSHLHFHVLPRWQGDTNFLPILADTKQISFDLSKIAAQLTQAYVRKQRSKK